MMRLPVSAVISTLLSIGLLSSCAARVGVNGRYYDRPHGDYHEWNDDERRHYQQWENETHHDDRDFNKRKHGEQDQYWKWRHDHPN